MLENRIETHLVKKQTILAVVCMQCNRSIESDEIHYLEEGVKEHLHSLLARKFCSNCYAKYGENTLLRGK